MSKTTDFEFTQKVLDDLKSIKSYEVDQQKDTAEFDQMILRDRL